MADESITFKIPKKIVDNLRKDFHLSPDTSNITVLRKAISISSFSANNGGINFNNNGKTTVKVGGSEFDLDIIT